MEEATEVSTEATFSVMIVLIEIRASHEEETERRDSSLVGYTEESLIEDLLDNQHERTHIRPILHLLLDIVDSLDSAVSLLHILWCSFLKAWELLIVVHVLIDTDVDFQVPHLLRDSLLLDAEVREFEPRGVKLLIVVLVLFLELVECLLEQLLVLLVADELQICYELDDRHLRCWNELDLVDDWVVYLFLLLFQFLEILVQKSHHSNGVVTLALGTVVLGLLNYACHNKVDITRLDCKFSGHGAEQLDAD